MGAETVALLTGATGYLGRNLKRSLEARGWVVHALGRQSEETRTTEDMIRRVAACKPSVVFHLASRFRAEHSSEDLDEMIEANLAFGVRLAEACARWGRCLFVNTGTAWQHKQGAGYNPVNLYAGMKQAYQDILRAYRVELGMKVVTLKLFDTYGPFDPRPRLLPKLVQALGATSVLELSPGHQEIDLVHVADVCRGFICLAERHTQGEALADEYGLGSGRRVTIRDLVRLLEQISGKQARVRWGGRPYRAQEVMVPWEQYQPPPGWAVQVSLEDGLRSLIEHGMPGTSEQNA